MALPTTTASTGIVRAPEPSGDTPPRHIPVPTSLRALPCVPSGLVVCAGHPEPCPAATGGSGFTIEIGSDFVIGPNTSPDPGKWGHFAALCARQRRDPWRAKLRSGTPEPIAQAIADGEGTNPFGEGVLNRFGAWSSGMKTLRQ